MSSNLKKVVARFEKLESAQAEEAVLVRQREALEDEEDERMRSLALIRSALRNTARAFAYFVDLDPDLIVIVVGLGVKRGGSLVTNGRQAFIQMAIEATILRREASAAAEKLEAVRQRLLRVQAQLHEVAELIRLMRQSLSVLVGLPCNAECECQRLRRSAEAGPRRRRVVTNILDFQSGIGKSFLIENVFIYKI